MLILSRKEEESIVIGKDIVVKVISIDKGSVRLGFDAPKDYVILRNELKEAIEGENKKAMVNKDVKESDFSAIKNLLKK